MSDHKREAGMCVYCRYVGYNSVITRGEMSGFLTFSDPLLTACTCDLEAADFSYRKADHRAAQTVANGIWFAGALSFSIGLLWLVL